jgi:hypothetical protein
MRRWVRDVIYSLVLLAFCVVGWVVANSFVQNVIKLPIAKPSSYAQLLFGILGGLALIQLIRALIKRPAEVLTPIWNWMAIITVVSLIAYIACLKYIGFIIATTILMAILVTAYTFGSGKIDTTNKKKMALQIGACVVTGFIITFVTYAIFHYGLGAKLAKGTIF